MRVLLWGRITFHARGLLKQQTANAWGRKSGQFGRVMGKLKEIRGQFARIGLILGGFSFVVNVLMLTLPLYMLQVYDRVLPASSGETLVFLTIIALLALTIMGALEAVRAIIASRVAARFDTILGAEALRLCLHRKGASALAEDAADKTTEIQPLRDLAAIRAFISSRIMFALLDLPFVPLFVGLLFIIHPFVFMLTLVGAGTLMALTWFGQKATSTINQTVQAAQTNAMVSAETLTRNAHTVRAMGMQNHAVALWGEHTAKALNAQAQMDQKSAWLSGLSKTVRLILQISIMGLGALLVLQESMTMGMIFAASIIASRGLQPLDQVIGNWKQITQAMTAWRNLSAALEEAPEEHKRTLMDAPRGDIFVEGVAVLADRKAGTPPILNRITCNLAAGEVLGVVGPSGSGKSTLARLLVGAQRPHGGKIRIDGTDIQHWDDVQLGLNLGYLGQEVELLPGTVAQNIARLDPNPDSAKVLEAARRAQVHELIQNLPNGYDTVIGTGGHGLSGGQRQRVALARAFYGSPPIMVLDEPNANLDDDGEIALQKAITEARKAGVTMIIITQRKQVLNVVDRILRLHKGNVDFFGTKQAFVEALQNQRGGQSKMQAANADQATQAAQSPPAANANPPARRARDKKSSPRIRLSGANRQAIAVRESDISGQEAIASQMAAPPAEKPKAQGGYVESVIGRQIIAQAPVITTPNTPHSMAMTEAGQNEKGPSA